jgi:hypothetical protein
VLADGSATAAIGHISIPAASAQNAERKEKRKDSGDILYPGTLTSRFKRYAAEPAPDEANLPSISERTANRGWIPGGRQSY